MCVFAAIFGISFILDDSAPHHQAHHSSSHFTVMSRFSTAVFTLSPQQTNQSLSDRRLLKLQLQAPNKPHYHELYYYSFLHPPSNQSMMSVCVCVCARTCACVSVRVLSAPWCLCLLSLERDALWFRCLFDSQFNNFLQTASPSSFLQRHFKSSLYFSKLESELFAVHSKWVFSWVLPHTQLSPQHRNQNHKVEKKKQQRFLPRTVPALLNSGWGMLADSSVHFLCWCGRPQSSNRFNSTAREPSWSFYFLALLRLRASRRCLSW